MVSGELKSGIAKVLRSVSPLTEFLLNCLKNIEVQEWLFFSYLGTPPASCPLPDK
jgi:hypothetical protein